MAFSIRNIFQKGGQQEAVPGMAPGGQNDFSLFGGGGAATAVAPSPFGGQAEGGGGFGGSIFKARDQDEDMQGQPVSARPGGSPFSPYGTPESVSLTVGDLLPRLPPELVRGGSVAQDQPVAISPQALEAALADGSLAVPVFEVYRVCPVLFQVPVSPQDPRMVQLPQSKLVALMSGRGNLGGGGQPQPQPQPGASPFGAAAMGSPFAFAAPTAEPLPGGQTPSGPLRPAGSLPPRRPAGMPPALPTHAEFAPTPALQLPGQEPAPPPMGGGGSPFSFQPAAASPFAMPGAEQGGSPFGQAVPPASQQGLSSMTSLLSSTSTPVTDPELGGGSAPLTAIASPFAEQPQAQAGGSAFAPQPQASASPFAPQPPAGGSPFSAQGPAGGSPFAQQPQAGGSPFAQQAQAGGSPFAAQPQAGGSPFAPQPQAGGSPFAPQAQAGGSPFAAQPQAGGSPFAPQPQAGGSPFAEQPQAGGSPFAPQPQAGGSPFAPQPQAGGSPFAPQPQAGGSPFAAQPQAGGSPFAPQPQAGGSPFAAQPQAAQESPFSPPTPAGSPFAAQPMGASPFAVPEAAASSFAPPSGASPFSMPAKSPEPAGGPTPFAPGASFEPSPRPTTPEPPKLGAVPFASPPMPAPAPLPTFTLPPLSSPASRPMTSGPARTDENVDISLAAVLKGQSPTDLGFDPNFIPAWINTKLPSALVRDQLATGQVLLDLGQIIDGTEATFRMVIAHGKREYKVKVPANEIFHLLPPVNQNVVVEPTPMPAAPPAPAPVASFLPLPPPPEVPTPPPAPAAVVEPAPAPAPVATIGFIQPLGFQMPFSSPMAARPPEPVPAPEPAPAPPLAAPMPPKVVPMASFDPFASNAGDWGGKSQSPNFEPAQANGLGSEQLFSPAAAEPAPVAVASPFPAAKPMADLPKPPTGPLPPDDNPFASLKDNPFIPAAAPKPAPLPAPAPTPAPALEAPLFNVAAVPAIAAIPAAKGPSISLGAVNGDPEQMLLRALLGASDKLTADNVVQLTAKLPGVLAAVAVMGSTTITHGGGDKAAQDFQSHAAETARSMRSLASLIGFEGAETLSITSGDRLITFSFADALAFGVLHGDREPASGLRDKITLIGRELASLISRSRS